jgi:hypothetical protein
MRLNLAANAAMALLMLMTVLPAASNAAQNLNLFNPHALSVESSKTWRSTVMIAIDEKWQCTGVFVRDNLILTAKHCFPDGTPAALRVVFFWGSDSSSQSSMTTENYEIIYNPSKDLALIKLGASIFPDANYYSMRTINSSDISTFDDLYNRSIFIGGSGWNNLTEIAYLGFIPATFNGYEAQYGGWLKLGSSGICGGDSGGPVMIESNGELVLIGITNASTANIDDSHKCGDGEAFTFIDDSVGTWISESN